MAVWEDDFNNSSLDSTKFDTSVGGSGTAVEGTEYVTISAPAAADAALLRLKSPYTIPTSMIPGFFIAVKARCSALSTNDVFHHLVLKRAASVPTVAAKATFDSGVNFAVTQRSDGKWCLMAYFDGFGTYYWNGTNQWIVNTPQWLNGTLDRHHIVRFWLNADRKFKIEILTGDGSQVIHTSDWIASSYQPSDATWIMVGKPYTATGTCAAIIDWVKWGNEYLSEGYYSGQNAAGQWDIGRAVTLDHGRHWTPVPSGVLGGSNFRTGFQAGEYVTHITDPSLVYHNDYRYLAVAHFNSNTSKYSISMFYIAAGTDPEVGTWTRCGTAAKIAPGGSGAPDENGCFAPMLVFDGSFGITGERWRCYYTGLNAAGQSTLCVAYIDTFSGSTWTKDGANPVLALGQGSVFDATAVRGSDYYHDVKEGIVRFFYGGGSSGADKLSGGVGRLDQLDPTIVARAQPTACIDRLSSVTSAITTLGSGSEAATVADSTVFQVKDWIILIASNGTTFQFNRVEAIPDTTHLTMSYPASADFGSGIVRHAYWGSVIPCNTQLWRFTYRSWPMVGNHKDANGDTLSAQGYAEGTTYAGMTLDRKSDQMLPMGMSGSWSARSVRGLRDIQRTLHWGFFYPVTDNTGLSYTVIMMGGYGVLSDGTQVVTVQERTLAPATNIVLYTSQDAGVTWQKVFTVYSGETTAGWYCDIIGNKMYFTRSVPTVNNPSQLYRVDYNPATLTFSLGVTAATIVAGHASYWYYNHGARYAVEPSTSPTPGRLWTGVRLYVNGDGRAIFKTYYSDNDGASWTFSKEHDGYSAYSPCMRVICLEKNTIVFWGRTGLNYSQISYNYRLHTAGPTSWVGGQYDLVAGIGGSWTYTAPAWCDAQPMEETPAKNALLVFTYHGDGASSMVNASRFSEDAGGTLTRVQIDGVAVGRTILGSSYPQISRRTNGWKVYYFHMEQMMWIRYKDILPSSNSFSGAAWGTMYTPEPGVLGPSNLTTVPVMAQAYNADAHCLAMSFGVSPTDALSYAVAVMPYRNPAGPAVQIRRLIPAPMEFLGGVGKTVGIPEEQLAGASATLTVDIEARPETTITVGVDLPLESLLGAPSRYMQACVEWEGALQLNLIAAIPMESAGILDRVTTIAVESVEGLGRIIEANLEGLEGVGRRVDIPREYSGALSLVRVRGLEIEAKGAMSRLVAIPVEAAGMIVLGAVKGMQVETWLKLAQRKQIEVEADGIVNGLYDTWNVYQKLSEMVLDEWTVIPMAVTVDFTETWRVISARNMDFIDMWRVLPQQIVTLFSNDIQLPSATMEKT